MRAEAWARAVGSGRTSRARETTWCSSATRGTEWSITGRHTGRTDIPLTEDGRRVARALEEPLREWSFTHVLTSPLVRARETCTLAGLGATAQVRPELAEWDYGDYEGLTTVEIRQARPDWDLWRDGCPGGETADDVGARIDRLLSEVQTLHGNVACFAHGHVLRVLGARWIGLPPRDGAAARALHRLDQRARQRARALGAVAVERRERGRAGRSGLKRAAGRGPPGGGARRARCLFDFRCW